MISQFDPNAAAARESGIFGLPYSIEDAKLVLIPVPWEVTTSYGGGTAHGPKAIFNASKQIDLYDIDLGNFYEAGIAMLDESAEIQAWNKIGKNAAYEVINNIDDLDEEEILQHINEVNKQSHLLNDFIYHQAKDMLSRKKLLGLVGGDHSSPLGMIKAHIEKYPEMGVLHIDAHADLRQAFEGFQYSHASIMYNVMEETTLVKLVQVGIRDFCQEEYDYIQQNENRISTFFDAAIQENKMKSKSWDHICDDIIQHLPQEVYISFDIDGLDPRFCPHTGTPVPGGLDYHEALYLIKKIVKSGRQIIGFDLNEVSLGAKTKNQEVVDPAAEWDANVGARILYKLCGWTLAS